MDCRLPPRDAWDARCALSLVRSVRALELRLSFSIFSLLEFDVWLPLVEMGDESNGAIRAAGDSGYEFEGIVGQHNGPSILPT